MSQLDWTLSRAVLSPKLRENSCVLPANWSDKNRSTKCLHVSALSVSAAGVACGRAAAAAAAPSRAVPWSVAGLPAGRFRPETFLRPIVNRCFVAYTLHSAPVAYAPCAVLDKGRDADFPS